MQLSLAFGSVLFASGRPELARLLRCVLFKFAESSGQESVLPGEDLHLSAHCLVPNWPVPLYLSIEGSPRSRAAAISSILSPGFMLARSPLGDPAVSLPSNFVGLNRKSCRCYLLCRFYFTHYRTDFIFFNKPSSLTSNSATSSSWSGEKLLTDWAFCFFARSGAWSASAASCKVDWVCRTASWHSREDLWSSFRSFSLSGWN